MYVRVRARKRHRQVSHFSPFKCWTILEFTIIVNPIFGIKTSSTIIWVYSTSLSMMMETMQEGNICSSLLHYKDARYFVDKWKGRRISISSHWSIILIGFHIWPPVWSVARIGPGHAINIQLPPLLASLCPVHCLDRGRPPASIIQHQSLH